MKVPLFGDTENRVLGLEISPPPPPPDDPFVALSTIAGKDARALQIILQYDALEKAAKAVLRDLIGSDVVAMETQRGALLAECRAAEDLLNQLQFKFNEVSSMMAMLDTSRIDNAQKELDQSIPRSRFPNPTEMERYNHAKAKVEHELAEADRRQQENRRYAQKLNFEIADAEKTLKERTDALRQLDQRISQLKKRWQADASAAPATQ